MTIQPSFQQQHQQQQQPSSNNSHPKRRVSILILIIVFSLLITLTSFILIAIPSSSSSNPINSQSRSSQQSPISNTLNSILIHKGQILSSSARQLSSDLSIWLDSFPTRLGPIIDQITSYYNYQNGDGRSSSYLSPEQQKLLQTQQDPFTFLRGPHPILPLLLSARASWRSILNSQPTSLEDARKDYADRYYPLLPPPGFDQWYAFAISKNFTLINRFDSLMADLSRFRNVSPTELNRRTSQLVKLEGVTRLRINPDLSTTTASSGARYLPGRSIKAIVDTIFRESGWRPDLRGPIDLAINEHSQPKVLPRLSRSVSGEEFDYLPQQVRDRYTAEDPETNPSLDGYKPQWGQDGNVWDAYRRACPPESAARRWVETLRSAESQTGAVAAGGGWSSDDQDDQKHFSLRPPTRRRTLLTNRTAPTPTRVELTFLSDLESRASFCDQPSTHHLHSAFFTDQRSIEHLYPLFSPSKPQGFADILIPSHYHYNPTSEVTYESELKRGLNNTPTDRAWPEKLGRMYWHGKMTRGANTPPGHMSSFQKQRLVKMVSNDTESVDLKAQKIGEIDPSRRLYTDRILITLNTTSSTLISVSESATVLDPLLLNIAIACDPTAGECKSYDAQGYFTQPPLPLSEAWKYKMVLDLDDVGFSPLFGAMMESKSAVVKMSVHQEFWRDWVQPWYHFIPLSSSYAEIHNLISFFVGIPERLKEKIQVLKSYHRSRKLRKGRPSSSTSTISDEKKSLGLNEHRGGKDGEGDDYEVEEGEDDDDEDNLKSFDGDEELRKIGEYGKDWKLRHMRKEDMEVYVFRLLIEWMRIMDLNQASKKDDKSLNKANHNINNQKEELGKKS